MTQFCSAESGFLHLFTASCPRSSHLCGTLCSCLWGIRLLSSTLTFSPFLCYPKAKRRLWSWGAWLWEVLTTNSWWEGIWSLHTILGGRVPPGLHFADSVSRRSYCLSFNAWMERQSLTPLLQQGGSTNKQQGINPSWKINSRHSQLFWATSPWVSWVTDYPAEHLSVRLTNRSAEVERISFQKGSAQPMLDVWAHFVI